MKSMILACVAYAMGVVGGGLFVYAVCKLNAILDRWDDVSEQR